MRQDFDIHIHPIFCGHEFLTMDDITNYIKDSNRYMVVTPHFDFNEWGDKEYNYPFNNKEIRDKQLELYKGLSKGDNKIILGGEFSVQTMLDFKGSKLLDDIRIKILSYHDRFMTNKYYMKKDGSIDMNETLKNRSNQPWYYSGRYSVNNLLSLLEECLKVFDVNILGHLERGIGDMLEDDATLEDHELLLDGSLDLAKKYGIVVEINTVKSTRDKKIELINKCKDRGIKMCVGLDAHNVDQLRTRSSIEYKDYVNIIGDEYLVSLDELLGMYR